MLQIGKSYENLYGLRNNDLKLHVKSFCRFCVFKVFSSSFILKLPQIILILGHLHTRDIWNQNQKLIFGP